MEVVVALLVLEVAVLGLVGSLVLASATMTRAESLERTVATAEGLLDSLVGSASVGADSVAQDGGWVVRWSLDDSGRVSLLASDPSGAVVLYLPSVVRAPR
jgi:hypothetical protein